MTRIHDLGGMSGFGPVEREADEPNFHAPWEARVLAMNLVAKGPEGWNIDKGRHTRERLEPVVYLGSSYYQRWLEGLVLRLKDGGLIEESEIEARMGAEGTDWERPAEPEKVEAMHARFSQHHPYTRPAPNGLPAPFEVGAWVRVMTEDPSGHCRAPRYVRGRVGTVEIRHGVHVFADTNGMGRGENPTHLYCVRFDARELFGDEAEPDASVTCDLWHPHLEAAE
ncbi:MAG: nitrile hydratase subunit beta [Pseudomonadota bacterium]